MRYVMMAIPAELVDAVSELVEGRTENAPSPVRLGAEEEGFVHGWTPEAVALAYKESADRMRDLLRFLANNADREVSAEEMAEAINARFGWNTVAGMLGAFGRRCANRYRRAEPMWDYRYDDRGRTLITMPRGVAEAILGVSKRF